MVLRREKIRGVLKCREYANLNFPQKFPSVVADQSEDTDQGSTAEISKRMAAITTTSLYRSLEEQIALQDRAKEQQRQERRVERQEQRIIPMKKERSRGGKLSAQPSGPPKPPRVKRKKKLPKIPKQTITNPPAVASTSVKHGDETVYPQQRFNRRVNPENSRWEGYRPRWLIEAERTIRIHPQDFYTVRALHHCMSVEQCAAFLRVAGASILRWEAGLEPIPYTAYALLALAYELQFLPHQIKEWADWKIIPDGAHVGMLLNTRTGRMFSAQELNVFPQVEAAAAIAVRKSRHLEQRVADLEAENARLRQLYINNEMAQELQGLQEKIGALLDVSKSTNVFDQLPINQVGQLKESLDVESCP
ncbi:MAG: hypothetical protein EKK46_00900 [Rhodocyclaceae bacterium]|nr:MAG: hypothetical protein EKK46_00900 [Rhodocyclaceae bacterium]